MATFTENETQTETSTSFGFNNTNQLDNQLDFSSAVPYTSYSPYQTTTETDIDEETTPSYEVEREYNINGLPEDEIIVPTFMPMVKSSEPEAKEAYDYKIKLNARGKIMATVFGVVVCFLIAFMVYNAVTISKLSNSLAYLEAEQASRTAGVSQLETTYQELTSESNLERLAGSDGIGFTYSPESSDISISLQQRPEISSPKESTNWFNNLCEFFSNLF